MDITGHFESASCVIEVDGSDTLGQVKGKLVAEFGVPRARHVGVRMRGGGDIGDDDLRICDTVIDEGCAVELYCTANITPGLIPHSGVHFLTLSPCDRYLAVTDNDNSASIDLRIFDTETHECLCSFPSSYYSIPMFSPCSEWISCDNKATGCAEVHDVKTGALQHSFGDPYDERKTTAWSPCGTKLLCCCKGLRVWDIATGVLVHEWDHIEECYAMLVAGDRVAMFGGVIPKDVTIWDYTTGVVVLVLTCPCSVNSLALTPNQRFVAACGRNCVRVWDIETGECVLRDAFENNYRWMDVAVSNDIVATYPFELCLWSISTSEKLLHRGIVNCDVDSPDCCGLAVSSCGGVVMYGTDEGVEIADISHLS